MEKSKISTEDVNREVVKFTRDLIGHDGVFGATFRKADGSLRTGSFRLGVRKHIAPGNPGMSYDPAARGNLIVFDMNKQGYRTIKLDRLISIRVNGQEFRFQQEVA